MTAPEQRKWVALFCAGNRAAGRPSAARNRLYKLLRMYGFDKEPAETLAEDLAQELFRRLASRIDRLGPVVGTDVWAIRRYSYRTLRNLVVTRVIQQANERLTPLPADEPSKDDPLPSVADRQTMANAGLEQGYATLETTGGLDLTGSLLRETNRLIAAGKVYQTDGRPVSTRPEARVNSAKVAAVALGIVAQIDDNVAMEALARLACWDGTAHSHWLDRDAQDRVVAAADPRFFHDPSVSDNTKAQHKRRLFQPAALLVGHAAGSVLNRIGVLVPGGAAATDTKQTS